MITGHARFLLETEINHSATDLVIKDDVVEIVDSRLFMLSNIILVKLHPNLESLDHNEERNGGKYCFPLNGHM